MVKWTWGKFNEVTSVYLGWTISPTSCVPTYPCWLCLSLSLFLFNQTHQHAWCGADGDTRVNSIIVAREREVLLTRFLERPSQGLPGAPWPPSATGRLRASLVLNSFRALPGTEQMSYAVYPSWPATLPLPPIHTSQSFAFAQPDCNIRSLLRNLSF